jgi:endo-1,4-beta-xylanase
MTTSRAAHSDTTMDHRRATASIVVRHPDGTPAADTDVIIEQTNHRFSFGNIGFDLIDHANGTELRDQLAADYLALFNTATLPFYLGDFETVEGKPATERVLTAARWFSDRGVRVKGHPLVWHTVKAPWLDTKPTAEVEAIVRARVRREVTDFAGAIDIWDVINEVVIMPVFNNEPDGIANAISRLCRDSGRIAMVRLAFEEARAANPGATLLINDFDLSSAYECLLEGLLEAGIPIDAIGLQTHMHQGYWGEDTMLAMVDRFARYGLPLHLTESTLLSGELMPKHIVDLNDYQPAQWPSTAEGEERQADELVRHYRSLVSHPAVQAITYWGITDDGAWLGAPSGLIRHDGSRKPGYDALHGLIKGEWWLAPTTARTDADGRCEISGFFGDYRLTVGERHADLALDAGATPTLAQL